MVIAHTATGFQQHFHLWIIKNMDLETVSHLATPIKEKSQKCLQHDSQETPKWTLKSIKMDTWTSRCLVGVPLESWITKMVTQVTKMNPQGFQNDNVGNKK